MLKNETIETIIQAIRVTAQGAQWISPRVLLSQEEADRKSRLRLSKREKNVLGLMLTGKTDRQMSQVLNIHDLHALIGRSPSFFVLGKILEEIHDYQSQKLSPDQKYKLLLEKRPEVIQTFPLKYISSYLGMTPETLSRVRSRIS